MWNFASSCIAGTVGSKKEPRHPNPNPKPGSSDCSDDEASFSVAGREEGLECPICWESFNIVENVPYVLWCGHTLCKNCILGLQWAVVKFPTLPIQLPLFISCPWCSLLSFRLVYRGALKFPRKNYFLLWMVESMNGDRVKNQTSFSEDRGSGPTWSPETSGASSGGCGLRQGTHNHHRPAELARPDERGPRSEDHLLGFERLHLSIKKSLFLFVHLTAKFPLVLIFLMIVVYAIPASAAILALYVLVTVLFALPSFLILYFSYPSLDWLVREIVT